jgi:hypothetical protein
MKLGLFMLWTDMRPIERGAYLAPQWTQGAAGGARTGVGIRVGSLAVPTARPSERRGTPRSKSSRPRVDSARGGSLRADRSER